MATTHKSTPQGHTDVYPPKSKPTRNKNLAAKQRSLNDEDNKITLDKNKKFRKKKKKENTSDTEKKQSNKSSREEAPNREDSSSPLNSGGDTGLCFSYSLNTWNIVFDVSNIYTIVSLIGYN